MRSGQGYLAVDVEVRGRAGVDVDLAVDVEGVGRVEYLIKFD